MSGATGAGSSGTSTGTESDGGGRGSATQATDSAANSSSSSYETHGSQGGTVTDTRGPQTQQHQAGAGPAASGAQPQPPAPDQPAASPLPGERQAQQPAGPYHPPQAYQNDAGQGGAVRRPRTGARTTPRVRKARLRVAKADPWSVMKVSFLLSIALGICTIVAAAVLWMVMDAMGVFSTVGGTISEATGSNESNGFDLQAFLSLPNVLLFTTVIAVIDVVLATALATLGAFIYNLSAGFVGGVELTLAEDE
ncbi:DUF3566 domain-containing protein [Streptomyces sp. S.PNR 29]|uniref:DUF3566 domain-containing protein n=1 Tax=Streptomyces sp. S.PNR 29 TaxID=2973805 RepID=UPI0025B23362|nr:DUF3566 domain-containing protein [Streptomyces sp. S.PNR 29]MDN0199306.1 DUF3566 domain-containing protein [Streptomyces sp. S.PNR 29]